MGGLRFDDPDQAIEVYARISERVSSPSRPQQALGFRWASSCARPRCASTSWRPVWIERDRQGLIVRRWEARCTRCQSAWGSDRLGIGVPRSPARVRAARGARGRPGERRDRELAEVASLGLLIGRLPPWQRLVYGSWVLCPLPGRREALVAAVLEASYPWAAVGEGVLDEARACGLLAPPAATDSLGRRRGERGEAASGWSWRQVRRLRDAGRHALRESLRVAGLLR